MADYTSGTTITVNPPGPRGCIDFTDLVVDDSLPYEGVESFAISIEGMVAMAIVIILDDDGKFIIYKCKNISIKMLKDVGMTVPKSRETRAVYMQQHRG